MKYLPIIISVLALSFVMTAVAVEETMSVARCQAIIKKGKQCPYPAESGKIYCWRHRGAVKAINETVDDAGKGAKEMWTDTKTATTNAWHHTKNGAVSAWDATKDAVDEARVGLVELLGGKDAKSTKSTK